MQQRPNGACATAAIKAGESQNVTLKQISAAELDQ
jgi:hypothetical protein